MTVRIYSFTSGRPELLAYQKATFARFLADEHELVVINDAVGEETAEAVDGAARELGLRCWSARGQGPGDPSQALARAMELAFRALVRFDDDISVLTHADIFACSPFSLRDLFDGEDMLAAPEHKVSEDSAMSLYYPWSGFIGFRVPSLPEPEQIHFAPCSINGVACDVPGMLWHYLDAHPQLRVRAIDHTGPISSTNGFAHMLPGGESLISGGRGVELVAGTLLHYLGATDWYGEGEDYHRRKLAWLLPLLDGLLAGEVTMPQRDVPAASSWPGR